jgi:hypothetical protein
MASPVYPARKKIQAPCKQKNRLGGVIDQHDEIAGRSPAVASTAPLIVAPSISISVRA